jgi:hypothetical protein
VSPICSSLTTLMSCNEEFSSSWSIVFPALGSIYSYPNPQADESGLETYCDALIDNRANVRQSQLQKHEIVNWDSGTWTKCFTSTLCGNGGQAAEKTDGIPLLLWPFFPPNLWRLFSVLGAIAAWGVGLLSVPGSKDSPWLFAIVS